MYEVEHLIGGQWVSGRRVHRRQGAGRGGQAGDGQSGSARRGAGRPRHPARIRRHSASREVTPGGQRSRRHHGARAEGSGRGDHDPLIVDEDVDPGWAARQAALGAFANAGQICVAVERIYVHQTIAAAFVAELAEAAREFEIGPLVDRAHREKVDAQVQAAIEEGAKPVAGGSIKDGPGSYYPPTVLFDCTDDMEVMREETFGPVAPVAVVGSFDEALRRAASSPYGLAATVLSASMERAFLAAQEISAGTVKINSVFGGAPGGAAHPRGVSGQGFGYGPELLDEMTFTKVVHLTKAGQ